MKRLIFLFFIPLIFAGSCERPMRCFNADDGDLNGDLARFERLRNHAEAQPLMEVGVVRQALAVQRSRLWRITRIPVCWEPVSYRSEDQWRRDLVRQAVTEQWENALTFDSENEDHERNIRFVGWDVCNNNADGIRILVSDDGPNVFGLGNDLAGMKNGMQLNFTFNNWGQGCNPETASDSWHRSCLYRIAVHEFGHALGITHEQNRSDREIGAAENGLNCGEDQLNGVDPDTQFGEWDPHSVMNYCNLVWDNGGVLSELDYLGIRAMYYPDLYDDYVCLPQDIFDEIVYQ